MRTLFLGALVALLIGMGCSSGGEDLIAQAQTPNSVAGLWVWKVGDSGCQVPGGFLSANEDEIFEVLQQGDLFSAEYTDSQGNTIRIAGSVFDGNCVAGKITITEGATPRQLAGDQPLRVVRIEVRRVGGRNESDRHGIHANSGREGLCKTNAQGIDETAVSSWALE